MNKFKPYILKTKGMVAKGIRESPGVPAWVRMQHSQISNCHYAHSQMRNLQTSIFGKPKEPGGGILKNGGGGKPVSILLDDGGIPGGGTNTGGGIDMLGGGIPVGGGIPNGGIPYGGGIPIGGRPIVKGGARDVEGRVIEEEDIGAIDG